MSDLMELKDQIKNTITMRDVIERLDLGPIRNNKIRSIYKSEKTPSLHVYKYDYFDYATGNGGDVIRFVMDAMSWSFVDAIRWLSRGGDELAPRRKEVEKRVHDFTDLFKSLDNFQKNVPWTVAANYVKEHWPTLAITDIIRYGSKLSDLGEIWTPHMDDRGRVVGIKIRNVFDNTKRSVTGSTFRQRLYYPNITYRIPPIRQAWIVEGESDSWALTKHIETHGGKVHVFALPSGAGLWRDEWRKQLNMYDHVIVCMDADDAGDAARDRIMGSLESGGISCGTFRPTLGQDVAEALAHGWMPMLKAGENRFFPVGGS